MPSVTRLTQLLLVILLLGGLSLRLAGLAYGLPYIYDADETLRVQQALDIFRNRDLNPHWFGHPAATTIYMLAALYGSIFAVGRLGGAFGSVADFVQLYRTDPTVLYLSGRLVSVIFGVLAIWLIYLIARRLFNRPVALAAAGMLALSPVHVHYSQRIRTDVQMGLFLLAAFWFCLGILDKGRWRDYILTGVFCGLAVVTKYPAAVFGLSVLLAHLLTKPSRCTDHVKLVASGGAAFGAAFVASPFLFLDYRTAWSDVMREARPAHLSHTGHSVATDLAWYASTALPESVSLLGSLLAAAGIVLCLLSKRRERWLAAFFPLSFLLFISMLSLRWVRWVVPAIPFLCILSAAAVDQVGRALAKRVSMQAGLATALILLTLTLVPLGLADVRRMTELAGIDTRTMARQWILDNIPPGSGLLMELYAPQLPKERYTFYYVDGNGELVQLDPARHKDATYRPIFGWSTALGTLETVDEIRRQGIEYIVMTNWYDRYLAEKQAYPTEVGKYECIMGLGTLIYQVEPADWVNEGPKIRIYQLSQAGSD